MNTYFNPKLRYPNLKPINNSQIRGMLDERGLLPFLVGAAVAFPIGYIASNTNKNNNISYSQQPYMQQPYLAYNQPIYHPYYGNLGYPIYPH